MRKLSSTVLTALLVVACKEKADNKPVGADKPVGGHTHGEALKPSGGDASPQGTDLDRPAGAGVKVGLAAAAIEEARDTVRSSDSWPETTARLEKALGPPKRKSATEWAWAVVDRETSCHYLKVQKRSDQDKVAGTGGGMFGRSEVDKDAFEQCKQLATGTP